MGSRTLLLLLVLLLALSALGAWLLVGGGASAGRGEVEIARVAPAPEVPREERGAADTTELLPPPRVELGEGSAATTVLWPLEVDLSLELADHMPVRPGVVPVGSGATARLSGQIADRRDQGVRAEIRFVAGPNKGRILRADVTGRFGATDLYPGLSIVDVSGPGLLGSRREVRLRQGADTLLNIGYGRPGSVFGRVLDRAGEGIEGAGVVFDGTRVTTDANGEFFLAAVASGQVLVEIEKEGYASLQALANVLAGAATPKERLTFTLEEGCSLSIRVPQDVGGPGPALVYLLPGRADRRPSRHEVQRNERFPFHRVNPIEVTPGRPHVVHGLPSGVVKVHAFRAGAIAPRKVVSLRSGDPQPLTIPLQPAPRIVGRVVADGEPVANATVKLEAPNRARAALAYLEEPSWFLETGVIDFLPPALQEVVTDANGRFVVTAWEEEAGVRYLEALGPAKEGAPRGWAGRLVSPGESQVELELGYERLGDATLAIDFPGRWQGLPIELTIDGVPHDPVVLPARRTFEVENLVPGRWSMRLSWHGEPIHEETSFQVAERTERSIELPPGMLEGQDEEAWSRAGREFPEQ